MEREIWIVEFKSKFIDVWYPCGPEYVSEEVADLSIKYTWHTMRRPLRVRRVA